MIFQPPVGVVTSGPGSSVGVASSVPGGHSVSAEQYHYPIHNNNNSFVSESSPYSLAGSINTSVNGSDVLQKVVSFGLLFQLFFQLGQFGGILSHFVKMDTIKIHLFRFWPIAARKLFQINLFELYSDQIFDGLTYILKYFDLLIFFCVGPY